jgi:hypothetical protein
MRTAGHVVLGLVAGFFAGLVLSEIIGILGFLAFDRAVGFRYLPLATGLAGAVVAALVRRRRS